MKQETLEETAQHVEFINDNIEQFDKAIKSFKQEAAESDDISILYPNEAFIEGAKWQQERSYSEEDMKSAWDSSEQNMRFTFSSSAYRNISFEQWLEQFKNE